MTTKPRDIPSEPIDGDQPMIEVTDHSGAVRSYPIGSDQPNGPAQVPVHVALSNAMSDIQSVGKDSHFSAPGMGTFNFRGIDATVNAVGPALRKHGIVPLPIAQDIIYRDTKTTGGKDTREVTVKATYRLYGPMGDYVEVTSPGESLDTGDKGTAKAMSVAFRILLLQMFAVPTGDADPDSQVYQRGEHEQRPAAPAAPKEDTSPLGKARAAAGAAYRARNLTYKEAEAEFAVWAIDPDAPDGNTVFSAAVPEQLLAFAAYLRKLTEDENNPVATPEPEPTTEEADPAALEAEQDAEALRKTEEAAAVERARARNAKLEPKE